MGDRSDDELAHTATAVARGTEASQPAPAGEHANANALAVAVPAVGKYRLEEQLGVGGMGIVYAAFDPDLERRVAIKLLKHEGGDVSRQRLLREARAMARLQHPNVVAVHEVGTIDGRDFVAMEELVDGESLAEWLRRAPRTRDEILDAYIAAGHGLAAAHAEGIVHRDFKPHNVLRSRKGRVLVTDFGLARGVDTALALTHSLAGAIADTAASAPLLTITGAIVGTPAYMAPEQWAGEAIGQATDQFAFCVALWEGLAGARPFAGETLQTLRAAIERGVDALDVSRLPRRMRPILRRGLAAEPARRWPSMDALLAAIEHARRVPRWWFVAGAGSLATVMLAALLVATQLGPTAPVPAPPPPPPPPPPGDPAIAVVDRVHFPDDHEELASAIDKTGPDHYEIARPYVDKIIAGHDHLFATDARFIPALTHGLPTGFKVYAVRADSVFAEVGLQDGDELLAVDGIPLTSPEKLLEIYREIHAAKRVVIDYKRDRDTRHITIDITDADSDTDTDTDTDPDH